MSKRRHFTAGEFERAAGQTQHGQAIISVVLLLALIGIAVGYSWVGGNTQNLQRARIEAETFARVKEALIGWSVSRTESTCPPCKRPGELPCPDANNDGDAEASCVAGAIGRVPWRTLGIDAPKDGTGETLWYAIAGPFRNWGDNHDPIHSDTKGNIVVYQGSTASVVTTEAIAVLFAPGASLGAQNRTTAAGTCPTTGTSIAGNLCAANYLDTAATVSNAATNGPYISAQASSMFNDKLMVIKTTDLMPIVEQRVAREVRTLLQKYKIATGLQGYNGGAGVYPWADCSGGDSDPGVNRGRIPWTVTLPVNWNAGIPATPTLPNWLTNQGTTNFNWLWTIYYAAGRNYLENFGAACTTCEAGQTFLNVNGTWTKEVVLITSGPAGASRPQGGIASGICDQPQWAAYLEDPENNDLANSTTLTPISYIGLTTTGGF